MMDLDTWHKGGRRLWLCAAIGALVLHVGGAALAVTQLKGEDLGEGLGAEGVEISLDMSSPKVEDSDAPKGDDSVAQAAQQEMQEQKAEVAETDAEKAVPTTTEDEADRQVTTSEVKKPTEDAKVATVETHAQAAQEAAEDSTKASLDTPKEADKARAANAGIGKDMQELTRDWYKKVSGVFKSHQRYPEGKTKGANVRVAFVLNRVGNILAADVLESSGDAAYDAAAIAMVRRSDPVPTPPTGLVDDQVKLDIWINFPKPKS